MTVPRVEVVLPTKNGARYLDELLNAARSQLVAYDGRLLAVDSGSTDETLSILRRHGVRVTEIPPDAFQHGRTRNLIAAMTDAATAYVVFLTQDATPRPGWLDGLVRCMESSPGIAGAFSRQVPRPDCNPLLARRMREEWPQVGGTSRVVKAVGAGRPIDPRRITHEQAHFANTSSCVRREVWRQIPFPEVDYAEDVAWARRVLEAGHSIVYEPSSSVWHSHGGSLWRTLADNVDHARGVGAAMTSGAQTAHLMPHQHGAAGRVARDMRTIWRGDASVARRIGWTAYAPFWYGMSIGGQWLGSRRGRVMTAVQEALSHQARVARGARG